MFGKDEIPPRAGEVQGDVPSRSLRWEMMTHYVRDGLAEMLFNLIDVISEIGGQQEAKTRPSQVWLV